jgi:uncharacterized protein
MMRLPDEVLSAWNDRAAPLALATVDADGTPNVIWVTCVTLLDDGRSSGDAQIGIADNFFSKTLANIRAGRRGALLLRNSESRPKAYQLKGRFEYHTEGPVFDAMQAWNLPDKPGKGTAVLHVEEVHSGATKLG